MAYLYVFIDESGNYDWSNKGTRFVVITSLLTTDVTPGVLELYELKHNLIDLGMDIEYFHATEDRQAVRDRVFNILSTFANARVDSVVVEKRKAAPAVRSLDRFYPMMIENLLRYPFDPRGLDVQRFDKVFIFLDRASARQTEQEALKKGVKLYLARHLGKIPYVICMHQSASHPYLQLVDYMCWAIFKKWERGEQRPYDRVKSLIRREFPIFQAGYKDWY